MCDWCYGLPGAAGQLVFAQVSSYEVSVVICEGSSCEDLPWSICWPHMQAIADMDKQGDICSTGQRLPTSWTIIRWATCVSKWKWQFHREEGPARGVRCLHSTIWVKCRPDFCIGVSAAASCVSDICLTLVPAVCMQSVALWRTSVSPIFGNCCKLDVQHMSSIMCLISCSWVKTVLAGEAQQDLSYLWLCGCSMQRFRCPTPLTWSTWGWMVMSRGLKHVCLCLLVTSGLTNLWQMSSLFLLFFARRKMNQWNIKKYELTISQV